MSVGRGTPRDARVRSRLRRRIRRPPAHWTLLGFTLGVLVVLLLAEGFTTRTTGPSGTPGPAGDAAFPAGSSPVLGERRGRLVGRPLVRGPVVALTFDDGPDERWTPRIAAELRRLGVPATFFVTGDRVVRNPGTVRDLHRQGFEIGNHTFTHADLSAMPAWRRSLELDLTDSAVAAAIGARPRLVRAPYSATAAGVGRTEVPALAATARDGRLIVLSSADSRDWLRPGAARIAARATPHGRGPAIVLMHDGGGERSQTVAAVRRLVPALRSRGFRFATVSSLVSLPRPASEVRASGIERARGWMLLGTLATARAVADVMAALLLLVAVLAVLRAALVVVLARRHARGSARARGEPPFTPPVSIVVPAFNEALSIERAVRSLAASDYPQLEMIVVDDGSTDGTAAIVRALDLDQVRVISQPNAGKAVALNAGLADAAHDVVAMVDADTVFEPVTLRRLVQPLRDDSVGAVSGNTKVGNRRGLLGRWQHVEYVLGFNLDRRMYDVLRCMPTVPGAIGAFRRDAIEEVGGVSSATLAEDTDLTIAIGRAGWRVVYAEDARAWTEAPASLSGLWRQRYRWSYGTMQAVWKHRAAVLSRGDERHIGWRGLPYLVLFQILLPLLAPLIDLFALYGLLFLDPLAVLAYWGGFNLLQLTLGLYAFRLDGEPALALWVLPAQQLVYRQLMYLVVIESVISAMLGLRLRWQHVERTGRVEVAR
jgi:cellulose synthase/poly-beta-1,6-N-acetylglucosamine synthase-like glycosyltransferase/peptidoglycan/xylan/chitin deacetylase (PgdA/CDA1 family)